MSIPAARLYFFYQPGCPACTSAEPQLAKFMRKVPHLMVIRRNAQKNGAPIAGFEPNGTPAYLLMVEGQEVWQHEGLLSESELQKVWAQVLAGDKPEPIDDEDSEDAIPRKRKGKETAAEAETEEEGETADEEAGRVEEGHQRDEEEE